MPIPLPLMAGDDGGLGFGGAIQGFGLFLRVAACNHARNLGLRLRFTVPEMSCPQPSARMRFWMAVRLTPYRLDRSDWLAPTSYSARMDSQSNRAAIVAPPGWPALFPFPQEPYMPPVLLFLRPRAVRQIILPGGPFPLQMRTPMTGLIGHRWPVHSSSTLSRTGSQNRGASGCRGGEHPRGYERSNGPAHCPHRHAALLRDGFLPHADFSGPFVHVQGERHTYKLFRWKKFRLKKPALERVGVHYSDDITVPACHPHGIRLHGNGASSHTWGCFLLTSGRSAS